MVKQFLNNRSGFVMETSKLIEILPSRKGKDLKKWLLKYNDVKIVTRDRSNSYSSAINEACPGAVQIADRFHLLMNLSDALDTYFKSINPKIRALIKDKTNEFLNMPGHGIVSDEKHCLQKRTRNLRTLSYLPVTLWPD